MTLHDDNGKIEPLSVTISNDNAKNEPRLTFTGRFDPEDTITKGQIDSFADAIRISWIEQQRKLVAGDTS